jgi:hypothetical protein
VKKIDLNGEGKKIDLVVVMELILGGNLFMDWYTNFGCKG